MVLGVRFVMVSTLLSVDLGFVALSAVLIVATLRRASSNPVISIGRKFLESTGHSGFIRGGIYAALSASTPEVVIEAVKFAKKHGTIVSYDLNYRPSLWEDFGGMTKCQEVNREIAQYVDVMIGNEEDFTACLGFEVDGVDENISHIPVEAFKRMIAKVTSEFPNFKATATTLRAVKSATINDWAAMVWHENEFYESIQFPNLEILDRVGGGDSFASGLIYGFLTANDPQGSRRLWLCSWRTRDDYTGRHHNGLT